MSKFLGFDQPTIKYSSWDLIKDINGFLKPYRGRFWRASLIRFLGDVAWLYPPFAIASVVTFLSHYHSGLPTAGLWTVVLLWSLAVLARAFSQFFAKLMGYEIAEKVAIDAQLSTLGHMFRLDMAWHERENSGNKVKRIQNASEGLNKILRIWFNNIIEISVNFVGIVIIISRFGHTVLLVLVLFLVSYFLISFFMTRRAGFSSYEVNQQEEEVNGLVFEAVNNIRTVKVMAMGRVLFQVVAKGTEELYRRIKIRVLRFQSRNTLLYLWGYIFRMAAMIFIIFGILQGRYEVGFLVLFYTYFGNIWESVDELSSATQDFVTSKFSIARMQEILKQPVNIESEQGKAEFPSGWHSIIFKDVSFSYGDVPVLANLSFEISRGQRVGVVGLSGAGKSTLFKLLLKEREGFSGEILFDGVSIKTIRAADYFSYVSVVLQDTEVFNFSLKDNITITNPGQEVNQRLLDKAINVAHVEDFLSKLPNGLNTVIGEKGFKLSGGERQRLGLARAIFKQPQILLLDEATSHLDLESEEKIQDSLHKFFETVTAVVIAHRLTTIKEMDKILVIEDGRLIEQGNFNELYKKGGRFYELWEKQKL